MEDGDMMRILVLEEKDSTTFLDASTDEKLHKAALSVVKSRLDSEWGCYYEEDAPESMNIAQEVMNRVPEGRGRDALDKESAQYKRELESSKRMNNDYRKAKKAIETNDGKLAWRLLQSRSDWEYERVYLAEVQNEYGEE